MKYQSELGLIVMDIKKQLLDEDLQYKMSISKLALDRINSSFKYSLSNMI
jgi:hypothetical protein